MATGYGKGNIGRKQQQQQHSLKKGALCSGKRVLIFLCIQTVFFFGSFVMLLHHHMILEEDYKEVLASKKLQEEQLNQRRKDFCAPPLESLDANETRRILLVHIGKTGGETLKHILRIGCLIRANQILKDKCWRNFAAQYNPDTQSSNNNQEPHREPILSKLVTGYFHYKRVNPQSSLQTSTHFLYTIRHPLARIQSWFRYISPLNCPKRYHQNDTSTNVWAKHEQGINGVPLNCRIRIALKNDTQSPESRFFQCFPTIEVLAKATPALALRSSKNKKNVMLLEKAAQSKTTSACSSQYWNMLSSTALQLKGSEGILGHWVMNYHYYLQRTIALQPNTTVLALRTESMWSDLKDLDIYFGGTGYFKNFGLRVTHNSEEFIDQANLSPEGGKMLCCILQHELELYRMIVQRAVNLNETERSLTLANSVKNCGMESWQALLDECRPYRNILVQRKLEMAPDNATSST